MGLLVNCIRLFFVLLFPFGWFFSSDLLSGQYAYYLLLNSVALGSSVAFLFVMRNILMKDIHLWVIFLIYQMGYFVTFYILCYMKTRYQDYASYLDSAFSNEMELLNSSALIVSYFETVTLVLVAFTTLVIALKLVSQCSSFTLRQPDTKGDSEIPIKLSHSTLKRLLLVTIVISAILLLIQSHLGLGITSGADRQVVQLPYRLAGIIMALITGFLPLVYIGILWLADRIRSPILASRGITAYLVFGVVSGLISTSKEPLMIVVVAMSVLWLVTGTFTKNRFRLIMALVPFIIVFNIFLAVNRMMRSLFEDLGMVEIFMLVLKTGLSADYEIYASRWSISGLSAVLAPLMRIDGSGPLLGIVNYAPSFDLDRVLSIVFESGLSVDALFVTEVLGEAIRDGVAFSPSLIGYFLFIFGNPWLVCIGVSLYTLVWHMIFRALTGLRLKATPILISLMIVALARFTISGTLEAMPQSIAMVLIFGLIAEFCLVRAFGRSSRQTSFPSSQRYSLSDSQQ